MANEFQLSDHINIICLPPPGFVPNQQNCFASGWGKCIFNLKKMCSFILISLSITISSGKDGFGVNGRSSVILKKVPLGIVEFNKCQADLQAARLGAQFRLDPSFICAGGIEGIDTCEVKSPHQMMALPLNWFS